ncbi:hypothetical protein F5051DRAFT_423516, partial [Lentinula edodes]
SSLYRWRSTFEQIGAVVKPPSPIRGRPRVIGLAAFTAMKDIYRTNVDTYLDELMWYLAIHHDTVISKSSLHENLRKAGLT